MSAAGMNFRKLIKHAALLWRQILERLFDAMRRSIPHPRPGRVVAAD
jgi:hypothetical protein